MKFTFVKFTNISLFSHLLKSYPHRNINFNKKGTETENRRGSRHQRHS